jgi:hypothetical protein
MIAAGISARTSATWLRRGTALSSWDSWEEDAAPRLRCVADPCDATTRTVRPQCDGGVARPTKHGCVRPPTTDALGGRVTRLTAHRPKRHAPHPRERCGKCVTHPSTPLRFSRFVEAKSRRGADGQSLWTSFMRRRIPRTRVVRASAVQVQWRFPLSVEVSAAPVRLGGRHLGVAAVAGAGGGGSGDGSGRRERVCQLPGSGAGRGATEKTCALVLAAGVARFVGMLDGRLPRAVH